MHRSFPGASLPRFYLQVEVNYVATPNRKGCVIAYQSGGSCLALPNFGGGVAGCQSGLPSTQHHYQPDNPGHHLGV